MATRLPASQHTREELTALIEGRLSTASAKDELVKLATRLIVEEALEGEAGDALGREYYEHGAQPGQGYRNGYRPGRLKTAEGRMEYSAPQIAGRDEPFRSAIREHLKGHTQGDWRIWRSRCWLDRDQFDGAVRCISDLSVCARRQARPEGWICVSFLCSLGGLAVGCRRRHRRWCRADVVAGF